MKGCVEDVLRSLFYVFSFIFGTLNFYVTCDRLDIVFERAHVEGVRHNEGYL